MPTFISSPQLTLSTQETSAAPAAPSLCHPGLPHFPWGLWCCDGGRVPTGPTGLFSHGGPGDLFQLWLGHQVLPALHCLPLVLPPTRTVVLCYGWLLPGMDTLLIRCHLSPYLSPFAPGWIFWWHPGPSSPSRGLSMLPMSNPATPNPHHWLSRVYSVSQNS